MQYIEPFLASLFFQPKLPPSCIGLSDSVLSPPITNICDTAIFIVSLLKFSSKLLNISPTFSE